MKGSKAEASNLVVNIVMIDAVYAWKETIEYSCYSHIKGLHCHFFFMIEWALVTLYTTKEILIMVEY